MALCQVTVHVCVKTLGTDLLLVVTKVRLCVKPLPIYFWWSQGSSSQLQILKLRLKQSAQRLYTLYIYMYACTLVC